MEQPTKTTSSEPSKVTCPIPDCVGIPGDHLSGDPAENLHMRPGNELELPSEGVEWPLSVTLTMDATTYPHWRILLDVWGLDEDLTAEQAGYMGMDITMNALLVAELNRATDEQLRSSHGT